MSKEPAACGSIEDTARSATLPRAFYRRVMRITGLSVASGLALWTAARADAPSPRKNDRPLRLSWGAPTDAERSLELRSGQVAYRIGGRGTTTAVYAGAADGRVIVELKGPPLSVQAAVRGANARRAVLREAARGLQAQHARVRQAILDLEAKRAATSRGEGGEPPLEIRFEYLRVFNGLALAAPRWLVERLRLNPEVRAVHPDAAVRADLADSVPLIRADELHARGLTGEGVVVGIIDSGIDYSHPDLGAGFGPAHKVIGGYDFVNGDGDPMDDYHHGTHVAGIVAAEGARKGVAPGAKLVAYKVLDKWGSGSASAVLAAIERAVDPDGDPSTDDALDVINLSLGGPGGPDDPVSQAIDNAAEAGVLAVAAAGNSGSDYYSVDVPGVARRALTVGATDKNDRLAESSSRGPADHVAFGLKPELVAPGASITSTMPGGGEASLSGTSMAAPHVSGAAALLLQARPGLSPEALKSLLMTTAHDLGQGLFAQGTGRIDVAAAAQRTMLVAPAALSFGLDDLAQPSFAASGTLTVSNLGPSARRFSASVADTGLPAGISLTVSPAQRELAPGASGSFTVSLHVDNGIVPNPEGEPFAYQGRVQLRSNEELVGIPVAFLKAALLEMSFDKEPRFVSIQDARGRSWNRLWPGQELVLPLPPGEYVVYTFFESWGDPGAGVPARVETVVREASLAARTALSVRSTEAVHVVTVKPLDEHGDPAPVDRRHVLIRRAGVPSYVEFLTVDEPESPTEWVFSPLDQRYRLDWLAVAEPLASAEMARSFSWHQAGLDSSRTLTNDPTELVDLELRLDADPGTEAVLLLRRSVVRANGEIWGWGSDRTLGPPFVWHHVVMPTPAGESAYGAVGVDVYRVLPPYGVQRIHTSPILQLSGGKISAYLAGLDGRIDLLGETRKTRFELGVEPFTWFGRFANSPEEIRLTSTYGPIGETAWLFVGQALDHREEARLPYELRRDGAVVSAGALPGDRTVPPIAVTPGEYALTIQGPPGNMAGAAAATRLTARFDTAAPDPDPPYVSRFQVLANGRPSKVFCVTDRAEVRFRARDDVRLARVQLLVRIGAERPWLPLLLRRDGEDLVALLPLGSFPLPNTCSSTTKAVPIALRLVATDAQGNSIDTEMTPGYLRLLPSALFGPAAP